jgi:hypothetical protein
MSRSSWEKHLTQSGQVGFGGKKHKYGAVPLTTGDGIRHASTGQAKRWMVLVQAQMAGLIADLRREVPFELEVGGVKVCVYRADHVYNLAGDLARERQAEWTKQGRTGQAPVRVVEDFKGTVTDASRLKMKLFEAVYGFPVTVVKIPTAAIG